MWLVHESEYDFVLIFIFRGDGAPEGREDRVARSALTNYGTIYITLSAHFLLYAVTLTESRIVVDINQTICSSLQTLLDQATKKSVIISMCMWVSQVVFSRICGIQSATSGVVIVGQVLLSNWEPEDVEYIVSHKM